MVLDGFHMKFSLFFDFIVKTCKMMNVICFLQIGLLFSKDLKLCFVFLVFAFLYKYKNTYVHIYVCWMFLYCCPQDVPWYHLGNKCHGNWGKKKTLEAANPARFSMCGSCYSELPLSVFLFTFPFPPLQQSSEAFIDPCYTLTPKSQQSKSLKKKKKAK